MRFIVIPLALLAACASDDYQRPRTVEYLTDAVLVPSCAAAQCHSSFARKDGYSFSTVDEARDSIVDMVAGAIDAPDHGDPDDALFVQVLTRTVKRMPYDQALPDGDQELIRDFIAIGAPGAQCNPDNGETQCLGLDKLITCGDDYNFTVVEDCTLRPPTDPGNVWKCVANACEEFTP